MGRTKIAGFHPKLYKTLQAIARETAAFQLKINSMSVVQGELNRDNATSRRPTGSARIGWRSGLMEILEAMAAGRGVTFFSEGAEFSTVQAAEVLNVSRPFLIKLFEDGSIPHRKVGKHRRVRMEDIMSYKAAIVRIPTYPAGRSYNIRSVVPGYTAT